MPQAGPHAGLRDRASRLVATERVTWPPTSQTWEWEFEHPPEAMWPLLADTARFNEAAKLPKHQITEIPQPDGSVHYFGAARMGPFDIKWQEKPVNWVSEQWFEHTRYFSSGPVKVLSAELHVEPHKGGSRARYSMSIEPANLFGKLILGKMFSGTKATFSKDGGRGRVLRVGPADASRFRSPRRPSATKRAAASTPWWRRSTPRPTATASRASSPTTSWQRRRSISGACAHSRWRACGTVRRATPSKCVCRRCAPACCNCAGTCCARAAGWPRAGPAGSIACRRARIARPATSTTSATSPATSRPASIPRRRCAPLESGEYCMWGPMSVPHVKAQVLLQPGETRELKATLPFGPYRYRTLEPGPEAEIDWQSGGMPELILEDGTVTAGAPAPAGTLRLTNRAQRPLIAIVEDRSWVADALTADRVTALQTFRDLFSDDVLRPGDEVAVGRIALLFSDLKGSTALYQSIGDASAYHLVRDHFAFMAKVIREHEGAIVKTIGDAVMAAFVVAAPGGRRRHRHPAPDRRLQPRKPRGGRGEPADRHQARRA